MKTDLLNNVGEIRPSEGEVRQGTGQTPVGSRIRHRITQISRQFRLSVDRSGVGLAISHPSPLQNIKCVLPLVKEKARRARLNNDAQEVVELTQILHSKLLLQRGNEERGGKEEREGRGGAGGRAAMEAAAAMIARLIPCKRE